MSFIEMAAYVTAAVLGIVLCRIFFKPLKSILLLVFHSLLGGVGLYIFNLIFGGLGFTVGLNIVTASVLGLLGLPGLFLLIIGKLIFMF